MELKATVDGIETRLSPDAELVSAMDAGALRALCSDVGMTDDEGAHAAMESLFGKDIFEGREIGALSITGYDQDVLLSLYSAWLLDATKAGIDEGMPFTDMFVDMMLAIYPNKDDKVPDLGHVPSFMKDVGTFAEWRGIDPERAKAELYEIDDLYHDPDKADDADQEDDPKSDESGTSDTDSKDSPKSDEPDTDDTNLEDSPKSDESDTDDTNLEDSPKSDESDTDDPDVDDSPKSDESDTDDTDSKAMSDTDDADSEDGSEPDAGDDGTDPDDTVDDQDDTDQELYGVESKGVPPESIESVHDDLGKPGYQLSDLDPQGLSDDIFRKQDLPIENPWNDGIDDLSVDDGQ